MSDPLYVFMPYLSTVERRQLRGIVLRNTSDLDDLSDDQQQDIRRLLKAFYFTDSLQPTSCVCAVVDLPVQFDEAPVLQQIRDAQTLIIYLCSVPDDRLDSMPLVSERGTIFTFRRWRFTPTAPLLPIGPHSTNSASAPPASAPVSLGYLGHRNLTNEIWLAPTSRIYPLVSFLGRSSQVDLSIVLDAFDEPSNWALTSVSQAIDVDISASDRQVLMAMEWYNASTSELVSEQEQLLRLAIAFECLLGLGRSEELTQRITEAILMLLGRMPLLESWIQQFYVARGQIVHQGISTQLRFHPLPSDQLTKIRKEKSASPPPTYGGLVHHGRLIFRLCANALRSSRRLSHELEVGQALLDDSQRLKKICELLDGASGPEASRLNIIAPYARNLLGFSREAADMVDQNALLGAAKRIIAAYLLSGVTFEAEFGAALARIKDSSHSTTYAELCQSIRSLDLMFARITAEHATGVNNPNEILRAFIKYASVWTLFHTPPSNQSQ